VLYICRRPCKWMDDGRKMINGNKWEKFAREIGCAKVFFRILVCSWEACGPPWLWVGGLCLAISVPNTAGFWPDHQLDMSTRSPSLSLGSLRVRWGLVRFKSGSCSGQPPHPFCKMRPGGARGGGASSCFALHSCHSKGSTP